MVRRLLVVTVAFSTVVAFAGRGDAADPGMVHVQIFRPGNNGPMNSIGCIITIAGDRGSGFCHDVVRGQANRQISGGTTTVLLGGDSVTCEIKPGVSLQAFTPRAMRPEEYRPDAKSWAPTKLTLHARAGETVGLGLAPKSSGTTYLGGWVLYPVSTAETPKRVSGR
jgi:hypothetical protein